MFLPRFSRSNFYLIHLRKPWYLFFHAHKLFKTTFNFFNCNIFFLKRMECKIEFQRKTSWKLNNLKVESILKFRAVYPFWSKSLFNLFERIKERNKNTYVPIHWEKRIIKQPKFSFKLMKHYRENVNEFSNLLIYQLINRKKKY